MKKITKKEITQKFREFAQLSFSSFGRADLDMKTWVFYACKLRTGKADRDSVYKFVREYAPTRRARALAWVLAYDRTNQSKRNRWAEMAIEKNGHPKNWDRLEAIQALREFVANPDSPYAKVPILGHGHLFFCSPSYGMRDYNKWQSVLLTPRNLEFAKLLCSIASKYAPRPQGKAAE